MRGLGIASTGAAGGNGDAVVSSRAMRMLDRLKYWLSPDKPYLWLVYLPFYFIPWFWRPPGTADIMAASVGLPLFLIIYFLGIRFEDRRALPYVAGLALISFALAFFNGNFSVLTVYAAALAGNIRPARTAGRAVASVALSLLVFCLAAGLPWTYWLLGLFFSVMIGVSCIFSSTLAEKNRLLERSQEEVRALAAAAERERIARDLHDLLGHTLTVVAVKSELAAKLVTRDPARAVRELEELNATARTALADIREAVAGMRSAALSSELAQARRALAAVDVALTFRGPAMPLPAEVEGALAMLLREGATNIVRHARASRCDLTVEIAGDQVLFTLADDGVGGPLVEGHGLAGMRARVAELGGVFQAEGTGAGIRLTASIPLPPHAPSDAAQAAPISAPLRQVTA